MLKNRNLWIAGLATAWFTCLPAAAQTYPDRPVTWVVGGAAGGPADIIARTIGQYVSTELGQPVLIENLGGAGGTIAVNKVAKSAPNGYTFMVGSLGYVAAAPSLMPNLPYDPVKDLDAVVRFPSATISLYVNAAARFNTVGEFIAYAKANPGKLNFGDAGSGSGSYLTALLFANGAGVKFTHVSYKGSAPAMVDLAAGQIDAAFDTVTSGLPLIRSGKVKSLGTTSATPIASMPGVPSISETVPAFEGSVWFGLYAPKGTPPAAIARVQDAYLAAAKNPELRRRIAELELTLPPENTWPAAAFQSFTEAEVQKYKVLLRDVNVAPR